MIHFLKGNLLESKAYALVNTVNTVGVMGKGIALQFKKAFPHNYKVYSDKCKDNQVTIGKILAVRDFDLLGGERLILNFPTKTNWRKPSSYEYIEKGLEDLVDTIIKYEIKTIAIPPLGTGNGGLNWQTVKEMMIRKLSNMNSTIYIYEPNNQVKEVLNSERVKLTTARAMLLYFLFKLVENGEFVSEFSSEKICYFLQRFGAEEYFKLDYQKNFYGPYSGKVKHVLFRLNGSYIKGYSGMDKKPFEELDLISDTYDDVLKFLNSKSDVKLKEIISKTENFLSGYYSNFALELLSTIDYIMLKNDADSLSEIRKHLENWNSRKKTLFDNDRYISIALNQLKSHRLNYN